MARIKRGLHGLKHRRKVMKLVKGFRAARRADGSAEILVAAREGTRPRAQAQRDRDRR